MDLNVYQEKVCTADVIGSVPMYPIADITATVGEISDIWTNWILSSVHGGSDWEVTSTKLTEKIRTIWLEIAVFAHLLDVPLEFIYYYACPDKFSDGKNTCYYVPRLAAAVGRLNKVWSKHLKRHEYALPDLEAIAKENLSNPTTFRAKLTSECIIILHIIIKLGALLNLDLNEVLSDQLDELEKREPISSAK